MIQSRSTATLLCFRLQVVCKSWESDIFLSFRCFQIDPTTEKMMDSVNLEGMRARSRGKTTYLRSH